MIAQESHDNVLDQHNRGKIPNVNDLKGIWKLTEKYALYACWGSGRSMGVSGSQERVDTLASTSTLIKVMMQSSKCHALAILVVLCCASFVAAAPKSKGKSRGKAVNVYSRRSGAAKQNYPAEPLDYVPCNARKVPCEPLFRKLEDLREDYAGSTPSSLNCYTDAAGSIYVHDPSERADPHAGKCGGSRRGSGEGNRNDSPRNSRPNRQQTEEEQDAGEQPERENSRNPNRDPKSQSTKSKKF